jgi:hypothetical protein
LTERPLLVELGRFGGNFMRNPIGKFDFFCSVLSGSGVHSGGPGSSDRILSSMSGKIC